MSPEELRKLAAELSPEELNSLIDELSDEEAARLEAAMSAPAEAQAPQETPTGQAALEGFGQGATLGYLPQIQAAAEKVTTPILNVLTGQDVESPDYLQARDENLRRQRALAEQAPVASGVGKLAGTLATAGLTPAAGTVRGAAALGAGMGAAANPGDVEGEISGLQVADRLKNAGIGALLGGGLSAAGKALRKGGDVGMQLAVGRSKYTPGVGETLADEGIVGTAGMMRGQVAKRMAERGKQMGELAKASGAKIDTSKIAQDVSDEVARPLLIEGAEVSARDLPQLSKIQELTKDIASRGMEPAEQALRRRVAAGASGFSSKTQDPLTSFIGKFSKAEQKAYTQALKDAVPGLRDADTAYAALAKASKSLNEEPSIPRSLFGIMSAGVGKNIPGTAAGASLLSRGAIGAGRGVESVNPAILRGLFEAKREK